MSAADHLEKLIYQFLSKTLSDEEKRNLLSGYDAERYIDEETEAEMKDAIFYAVKCRVYWPKILDKLRDEVEDETDDEESCASDREDDE